MIRKSTAEKRLSYFTKDIVQIPSHSPDSLNDLDLETHRPRSDERVEVECFPATRSRSNSTSSSITYTVESRTERERRETEQERRETDEFEANMQQRLEQLRTIENDEQKAVGIADNLDEQKYEDIPAEEEVNLEDPIATTNDDRDAGQNEQEEQADDVALNVESSSVSMQIVADENDLAESAIDKDNVEISESAICTEGVSVSEEEKGATAAENNEEAIAEEQQVDEKEDRLAESVIEIAAVTSDEPTLAEHDGRVSPVPVSEWPLLLAFFVS